MKNLIAKGEASSWIGPPGMGKSAVLTEIAIRAAGGIDFRNFRSKGSCGVVHLAFERATHTRRRMTAYTMRGYKGLPIAIRSGIVNLMDPGCVALIVQVTQEAEAHLGTPIGLVVIDTLAKGIAIGGGDENAAKDVGKALGHLNAIREATGCHTAVIHHTGKDVTRGARGSNAQVGDVDAEFTISGDKVKVVTVTKANDQMEGEAFRFTFTSEEIGRDDDGDPITVGILADGEAGASLLSEAREWPGKIVRLRDAINEVILDGRGFDYSIPRGPTVRAVHLDDLRALYRKNVVSVNSDQKRPHKTADNALTADVKRALELHLIGSTNILHKGAVRAV